MNRNAPQILDEFLVLQSQSGNSDSLSKLIMRYRMRLLHHAYRITGLRSAAEDIVQDTSISLMKSIHTLKDPALFKSWVFRITTNKCRDWLRKQKRLSEQSLDNETLPTVYEQNHSELHGMRVAISQLPADSQLMISMFYQEGMNLKEIAVSLNVPVGTVKSRLYHARLKLKELIEGDENE